MDAEDRRKLEFGLIGIRLSVFLVMLMWTLDKFLRIEHAQTVFSKFYFLNGFSNSIMYLIGFAEAVLIFAFLLGIKRNFTYLAVFVLHGISTLSSFNQYINPFEGGNLLFFAAWPMLAASYVLYIFRNEDNKFILIKGNSGS